MILYSQKVRDELDRWSRPFAPSVIVAKSFRAEGPASAPVASDPAQQQQQEVGPVDPFAGMDIDALPEDIRQTITKAQTQFASLQTKEAEASKGREKADKEARIHQARADQFQSKLQHHGLFDDPARPKANAESPEAALEKELAADYLGMGFDKPTAEAYAKLQAKTFQKLQGRILAEVGGAVGPTVSTVGMMQADRMLLNAANSEQFGEPLADSEIYNVARETLMTLAQSGQRIDQPMLETAIKMAVGEITMKGPNANKQQQTRFQPPQARSVTGGTRFTGYSGAAPNPRPSNGAPVAANAETAAAAAKITEHMRRGMAKKTT